MSIDRYQLLTLHRKLTNQIIRYFTAEVTNPTLFEEIKRIGIERSNNLRKSNGATFINMGYLSVFDFAMYMRETNEITGGIKMKIVELILKALEEEAIVTSLQEHFGDNQDKRYKANGEYTKLLHERHLIFNVLCGWRYIIENYCNSVVKIENKSVDSSIGTGFYFAAKYKDIQKYLIITNRHVFDNAKSIKVLSNDDIEIKYSSIKTDNNRDLGFIELENQLLTPSFSLNPSIEILSELITIGYPSIPMTRDAYQVCHKGELNSFVVDYSGNKLFLFSAKTSSGNSGSPIIDKKGTVIGIVTEELFEQEQFKTKGKLPYYAGIPTEEIIKSIKEVVFNQ